MRIVGIVFFVLLAGLVGLRVFRPDPAPDWYRYATIATSVGMIVCLTIRVVAEWRERPRPARPAGGPADTPGGPAGA